MKALSLEELQRIRHQIRVRRVLAVLIVLGFMGLTLAVPVRTYYNTWQHGKSLDSKNIELQQKISTLSRQREAQNDRAWIESQARERLLMVFPGEKAYRFEQASPNTLSNQQKKLERGDKQTWYGEIWNTLSIPQ